VGGDIAHHHQALIDDVAPASRDQGRLVGEEAHQIDVAVRAGLAPRVAPHQRDGLDGRGVEALGELLDIGRYVHGD
jgi:hypothetical protein